MGLGQFGEKCFWIQFVDLAGEVIKAGLTVRIFNTNGTLATVYRNEIRGAMPNPITPEAMAAMDNGRIVWWSNAKAFIVEAVDPDGMTYRYPVNLFTHALTLDPNQVHDDGLVGVALATGENLSNEEGEEGTFVDYDPVLIIDGTRMRAGDILRIHGLIEIENFTALNTLDVRLVAVAGNTTLTLVQTGDLQPSAIGDLIDLRLDMVVRSLDTDEDEAVVSGLGYLATKLNATEVVKLVNLAPADLPLTGNVTLKFQGDYSDSAATNLSHIKEFTVEVIRLRQ